MEVYFLDVGQGTSNVILTGRQQAFVIDGGLRTGKVLLKALDTFKVDRLTRLIVSHNDDDHANGALAVLEAYRDRIDQIWMLEDRVSGRPRFPTRVMEMVREGILPPRSVGRLEMRPDEKAIFRDYVDNIELTILSPSYFENEEARARDDANATSAVLQLKVLSDSVVFAADSTIAQWREIHREHGQIACGVLAVPHHGGHMGDGEGDLEWLYREAIQARAAVISVGSGNSHNHPRREVVQRLTSCGSKVLCTQITPNCWEGDLENVRPGVQRPLEFVRRSVACRDVANGKSRNVACGGTVIADLVDGRFVIRNLAGHQSGVDRIAALPTGCPMCRHAILPAPAVA
jgi:beta-lactamase superfamily II metal-dependent hydrolase